MTAPTDKWKEKYLNQLDLQEQQEQEWQERLALLSRVQGRLSVAAQGQDSLLDEALVALRPLLNSQADNSRIEQALEELDDHVLLLDESRLEAEAHLAEAFIKICRVLLNLQPPQPLSDRIHVLIELVNTGSKLKYAKNWQELADCLVLTLQQGGVESKANKGFWSRLFGHQKDTTVRSSIDSSSSVSPTTFDVANTASALSSSSSDAHSGEQAGVGEVYASPASFDQGLLGLEVSHILKNLLSHLSPPADMEDTVLELQNKLDTRLNWYELVPVLEDISSLVIQALDHDQKEFEVFLKSLDSRLLDMQSGLESVRDNQRSAGTESRSFDLSVREHVGQLAHNVDRSSDLQELKQNVRVHIEQMAQTLDQFQQAQCEREALMMAQFGSLAERMAQIEAQSRQAQSHLEEQRLRSMLDSLTQLPNREAYEQRLSEELSRFRRYQRSASFVVGDIDHFKQVNDTYGHLAGDKVLKVVAKILRQRLRESDFVARYGGEEFALIMPETDPESALQTVDAIRQAIEQCPFHFKDTRLAITMSFGITAFSADDDISSLFSRADQALYTAKDSGRNTCIVH
jgi:diguanylate cyclase